MSDISTTKNISRIKPSNTFVIRDGNESSFIPKLSKIKINNLYMYVLNEIDVVFAYKDHLTGEFFALPLTDLSYYNGDHKSDGTFPKESRKITQKTFKKYRDVKLVKIAPFKVNVNYSRLLFLPLISRKSEPNLNYGLMIYQEDYRGKLHELLPREYHFENTLEPQVEKLEDVFDGNSINSGELVLSHINPDIVRKFKKYHKKYSKDNRTIYDIDDVFYDKFHQSKRYVERKELKNITLNIS